MAAINPSRWYRIPGYNGYEYCHYLHAVRSMKNPFSHPGYVLKRYGKDIDTYKWNVTNDANKRVEITEYEILTLLYDAPTLVDGTNGINFSGRRHLNREKGCHQKSIDRDIDTPTGYADFSYLGG